MDEQAISHLIKATAMLQLATESVHPQMRSRTRRIWRSVKKLLHDVETARLKRWVEAHPVWGGDSER